MNTSKLVAGTLLLGIGIASGNANLMATAGGIGVNWISEAVPGLWASFAKAPDSRPLATAYANAIQLAAEQLQADYGKTIDSRSAGKAFALVAACAASIASAEFPDAVYDVNSAQRRLQQALAQLLHGHDERQIAFLQQRLLPTCAQHFQSQLLQNEAAWRAFHGLLLQALAVNSATLMQRIDNFANLLTAWGKPEVALQSLHASLAQIEALNARIDATITQSAAGVQRIEEKVDRLVSQPPTKGGATFNNQGMKVGGNVYQGGTQYFGSAHTEGGGNTTVVNNFGTRSRPLPDQRDAVATPIKILFLAANPIDTERLRLDQEVRTIDERLRLSSQGKRFQLAQQWAVRIDDIIDAIYRHKPQIVHFSGHGSPDGKLFFENVLGNTVAISSAALGILFASFRDVRCVVLNACWSQRHARTIANNVGCVVGMQHPISDEAAIHFVSAFYRALGEGDSVQQAFDLGRAQLALATDRGKPNEKNTPRLLTQKGLDPATIRFG